MHISRELLTAKLKQAIEERDRHIASANAAVGRVAALNDLLAVLDLPEPVPPPPPPSP